MALTTAGREFLIRAAMGLETNFFNEANSYIEVGNSSAAFNPAQTTLLGSNKVRKKMNAGYPKVLSPTQIEIQVDFLEEEAVFAWEEWGWFNAALNGVMLSREVSTQGLKPSGKKWTLQSIVTITA